MLQKTLYRCSLGLLSLCLMVRPLLDAALFPAWSTSIDAALLASAGVLIFLRIRHMFSVLHDLRYPLIAWALALLIGLSLHHISTHGWRDLTALAAGPIVLCAAALTWGPYRRWLLHGILVVASLISAFAIWQSLVILPKLASHTVGATAGSLQALLHEVASRGRPLGTFVLPTLLAGYLLLIIPLALCECFRPTPAPWVRALRWASFVLASTAWILARSLGAWLSLVVACLIVSLIMGHRLPRWARASFVMIALLAVVLMVCGRPQVWTYTNAHNPIHNRLVYWDAAQHLIAEHPITGLGPGTFEEGYRRVTTQPQLGVKYAHNTYLQLWVEWGLFGLLAWGWLVGVILRRTTRVNPWIAIALWALPLHNVVDFSFYVPQVSLLWWYLAGWSLRLPSRIRY